MQIKKHRFKTKQITEEVSNNIDKSENLKLTIGNIVEGTVDNITKYGAFVKLPNNKKGLVHISEVSSDYVKEVRDYLTENQKIKVKILSITDDGKIGLSIRQATESYNITSNIEHKDKSFNKISGENVSGGRTEFKGNSGRRKMSFEDMMDRFKRISSDKLEEFNNRFPTTINRRSNMK